MNNNGNEYKDAINSLLSGMQYMIEQAVKNCTQIYNGTIISIYGNNYTVKVNGNDYVLRPYGEGSYEKNNIVKVFVPQGNMNLAFFI